MGLGFNSTAIELWTIVLTHPKLSKGHKAKLFPPSYAPPNNDLFVGYAEEPFRLSLVSAAAFGFLGICK